MSEPIVFTHRFVARADTGRRLARAYVFGEAMRSRSQWVVNLVLLAAFTVILMTGMDERFSFGTRLAWAVLYALVPTVLLGGMFLVIAYVTTVRSARVRLFQGAVLESGFGEGEMVLRNPLSEARLMYTGIKSLTPRGDFVFMRQHGVPRVSGHPRELFPDEQIARVNQQAR